MKRQTVDELIACLAWVADNLNSLSLVKDKEWIAMCGTAQYRSCVGRGDSKISALMALWFDAVNK